MGGAAPKPTFSLDELRLIVETAKSRGVPVVAQVELRPVPYSSAIYNIEIPEQLAEIEEDEE